MVHPRQRGTLEAEGRRWITPHVYHNFAARLFQVKEYAIQYGTSHLNGLV